MRSNEPAACREAALARPEIGRNDALLAAYQERQARFESDNRELRRLEALGYGAGDGAYDEKIEAAASNMMALFDLCDCIALEVRELAGDCAALRSIPERFFSGELDAAD